MVVTELVNWLLQNWLTGCYRTGCYSNGKRGRAIDDPNKLLKEFIWSKKWIYGAGIFSILVSELILVQFPNILGQFTNTLSQGQLTMHGVVVYSLKLALVGVLYVILYGVGQMTNGRTGRQFEYLLRRRLFAHWETLSTAYFRGRSIGDLLNHAMSDVQTVRESLSGGMNMMSNAVFLLASTLFMTFRTVSVTLTLVSMIPILFVPLFVIWMGPKVRSASRQVQESLSDMAELTEESLSAVRLVKATANESIEAKRFERRVDAIVSKQMHLFRRSAMFQSLIPLMGSVSFVIALGYGGYLTLIGDIKLGGFVAFTLYLGMLTTPLQQIGFVINNFQRASASLARLKTLLLEAPDIVDPQHPVELGTVHGAIRIDLPEYHYPDGDHAALRDISLHVSPGETVGIVGRTASGKTTLVNLLLRIFDPPPGTVFLDGVDTRELRLAALREAIAYVPQDGFLFSTTVGENISFGREDATPHEIAEAARYACMYDEVQEFPDKFNTVIGERGVALSGGQKQRTAIARAFLKEAPVLVLDDSLSAVDMNTEKTILSHLRELRQDKTTLIIAHRLSAVRHADQILVLDDGQPIEHGTHDELVAAGGVYAEMYAMQQETEEVTA
ncbi:ABC transporter ATP-binding protein [Alicyclobacillus sp. ALC3]|uniref:ABC transporter ATP-binding protein n=1 Tax=Alicyclobacillus sp. ALC3 TaxID=2796143 RepID=UPI0023788189|nr:ABC transporter ATP-binding protein [Alicyclobacillus sp. ALC3]WDL95886.1 ABC transporter ATP-binding protein [Alicyclobacillus sp. ALC3]